VKFLTKHRLPTIGVSVALSVAIGLYTAAPGSTAAAAVAAPVPRHSAVELADAILFHDGIAARYVGGQAVDTEKIKSIEESVNKAVTAKSTAWQQSFADRIQSGDRIQIQSALGDLGQLYHDLLTGKFGAAKVDQAVHRAQQQVDKSSPDALASGNVNVNTNINVNYTVAAAALDLALVVAALVLVLLVFPVAPSDNAGGAGAKLAAEQYVDQIATSLRAA
jgi:hypothetical protein